MSETRAVERRRRILITGGSSGIGRAVASRLSATNDVWLWGSRAETAAEAASSMNVAGSDGVDITDFDAVEVGVGRIVAELGGLDGVFINAGIDGTGKPALEVSPENFRRVLDVNVIGAFNVAKVVIPYLSRPGSVVFNASVNALRPEANFVDYNASKAAVVSMAQTFALELAEQGVTVLAVCPGYFPTKMTESYLSDPDLLPELLSLVPARRVGDLAEIAAVVEFLLSDGARFMSGAAVPVDGGRSI
jgi:NAD(P)-dependent dehydrogenase (short-subunit alcohol dehydrogenase family)